MVMLPPDGVYLDALRRKLTVVCASRLASATTHVASCSRTVSFVISSR